MTDAGSNRVLVVGSSNTDLVCRASRFPRSGETLRGDSFATFAGGKGANQAVAAARAGANVVFAGAVGDDAFGHDRVAELSSEGIDTSRVRVVQGLASGVALIVVDASGENSIIVVAGANGAITPTDAREAVSSVPHAVLSLTLEIPFDAVAAAIEGSTAGSTIVLNAAPFDPAVAELLGSVDVLVCNEVEAGELIGSAVNSPNAEHSAITLLERGCKAVAITLGKDGAVVAAGDQVSRVRAPAVKVIDTTGAGDAFCGTLAAWLALGSSLDEATRAAVIAGAIAVTRSGAQPSLPTRAEILTMFAGEPRG